VVNVKSKKEKKKKKHGEKVEENGMLGERICLGNLECFTISTSSIGRVGEVRE
jgi:hypothetical protein